MVQQLSLFLTSISKWFIFTEIVIKIDSFKQSVFTSNEVIQIIWLVSVHCLNEKYESYLKN